ncbi:MAG: carbohydrate kinase family protein [Defluviitaleaceae bacterium]|nr:carbohydrate kinase family protein [Defluviitaleaceae bacterium]
MNENLKNLRLQLEAKKGFALDMIIGLDGFVDVIIHVVDQRKDFENYTRLATISDMAARIGKAAGLSANFEWVPQNIKLGGNGPILSNALLEYGVRLTYVGGLGANGIHPVFKPMADKAAAVYSLSDPGHTNALEFEDGKLMMGTINTLDAINWKSFKEKVGPPQKIADMINKCDLFGMENWTMVAYMGEIWDGLIDEVFPLLNDRGVKPLAFFDLADPEKRTASDILHAMKQIGKFESKFRAVLGLNEKELYEIAEVFGVELSENPDDKLKQAVCDTYKRLGIYCLVVHPTKEAMCCTADGFFRVAGPYCAKPVLTTGAGDNFNAGFCLGLSLGLDPASALTLGVSTSGYYVRNAKSPTFDDVIGFIGRWEEGSL